MQIQTLNETLSVLTAMVTPVVLILASTSLVSATSTRLSRAIDRTRTLSERITDLAKQDDRTLLDEERRLLFGQMERAARRTTLLTRCLTQLYGALAIFIATSVALGVVAAFGVPFAWVALALGMFGSALLFWTSVLLIREGRLALVSVYEEMDFVKRIGEQYGPPAAPRNLVERGIPLRRKRKE